MASLITNLFWHYINDAWVFCTLHGVFLVIFLFRWGRSWRRLGKLMNDETGTSGPDFDWAKNQITTYTNQGREPDLPRIEGYVTDEFQHEPELIRGLINAFIVVGLMGTLFSLFALGQKATDLGKPAEILSGMGIAFSTSFFGIVWALICSVLLLNPLRRRSNKVVQKIHRKLTELSAAHPPETLQTGFKLVAESLRENVNSIGAVINTLAEREAENQILSRQILAQFSNTTAGMMNQLSTSMEEAHTRSEKVLGESLSSIEVIVKGLEEREAENRMSSQQILTQFSDTTTGVISQFMTNLEEAQTRTTMLSLSLKESMTSSLTQLQERFLEISESWRAEMRQTLAETESAAIRLSGSSNNLAESTKEVSNTLRSVSSALEKTKELAEIVVAIEKLTRIYLEQTGDQINIFKTGLETTLEGVRTIPHQWYTMLMDVKDDLAMQIQQTVDKWQAHVEDTGNILVSRTDAVSSSITTLSEFFAPQAALMQTLKELNEFLLQTKDWLDTYSQTVAGPFVEGTVSAPESPEPPVDAIDTTGTSNGRMDDNAGAHFVTLIETVESIRGQLDLLINKEAPLTSEPPIADMPPEGIIGPEPAEIYVASDVTVEGQNGEVEVIESGPDIDEDRHSETKTESHEGDTAEHASDHSSNNPANEIHPQMDLVEVTASSERNNGQNGGRQIEVANTLVETDDNHDVSDKSESGETIDTNPPETSPNKVLDSNGESTTKAVGWRRFWPKPLRKRFGYE